MSKRLIVVFISTHETMKAERVFNEGGIRVRTTTRPRSIESNCQLALTFKENELSKIMEVTEKHTQTGSPMFC